MNLHTCSLSTSIGVVPTVLTPVVLYRSGLPIPFQLLLLLAYFGVLLFILGETAEHYFCPSLQQIARFLHLTPDVAGATLLAFGNGAPDFFTNIAAVNDRDNFNLSLAVEFVVGACNFVVMVVLAGGASPYPNVCNLSSSPTF